MRVRTTGRRARILLAASCAFVAPAFAATTARADNAEQLDLDWRQRDRTDHYGRRRIEYPNWAFELRFGAYYPRVDTEPALVAAGATPYKDVFGDGPRFYLGFEVDWVPLRVPFVGGVGPGFGFGWTDASAKAKIALDPSTNPPNDQCLGTLNGCDSAEDTSLTIFPFYLVAVFRLDEPMIRWGIPLVPYVKFGLDMGVWTSGSTVPKSYINAQGKVIDSVGVSWGPHFALGGQFLLNWLDTDAVNRSREASGVRNFYAFGEWTEFQFATLGSQKQLRVGSSSWVVGVAVDL